MFMKDLVKNLNIAMICLIALVAKLVILGGTLPDAIAVLGIAGFLGAKLYIDVKRDNLLDVANQQIAKIAEEYHKLSAEIGSMKLRVGMEQNSRKLSGVEKQEREQKRFF
jgi:hypothetical protein